MRSGQWPMGNIGQLVGERRKMVGEKEGCLSGQDTNEP